MSCCVKCVSVLSVVIAVIVKHFTYVLGPCSIPYMISFPCQMENCMIDGWMNEWRIGAVDLVNMNDTSLAYRVGHEDGILCLKDIWFG